MQFTIALKMIISFTAGIMFWFWVMLVFMVYSFLPPTKIPNSIIFSVVAPSLYIVGMNLLFKKMFKDTGWKQYLINGLVTLAMTGLSLLILDTVTKMFY
ncbi:MAG: hypothetical protein ACOY4Q_04510 [Bacillota bacterium]